MRSDEHRKDAAISSKTVGVAEASKQLGAHTTQIYDWRKKIWHDMNMNMVAVDRSRVDPSHLLALRYLPQQLVGPTSNITQQYLLPVFRAADDVVLEIPHRVPTSFVAQHVLKLHHYAPVQNCPPPKGVWFTDTLLGRL